MHRHMLVGFVGGSGEGTWLLWVFVAEDMVMLINWVSDWEKRFVDMLCSCLESFGGLVGLASCSPCGFLP